MTQLPDQRASPEPLTAPVALFVFNRPDYTKRVLEAVRRVRPTSLYLIADGPRPDHAGEAAQCLEVRRILAKGIDWPCKLRQNHSDSNLGCRNRIVSGLTWLFEQVDRAIILEDDCAPEASFFSFCQELLERYRDDSRIGMLSGTNYRLNYPTPGGSYFFARHHSIWGWATWRRAFEGFDPNMKAWRESVSAHALDAYWEDQRSRLIHRTMFDLFREGGVDTWDIPWVFHLVQQRMLSVVPHLNQVTNIGVAGTRGRGDDQNNNLPSHPLSFPLRHPQPVEADSAYDRFVSRRHRLVRDWLRARWTHRIRHLLMRP